MVFRPVDHVGFPRTIRTVALIVLVLNTVVILTVISVLVNAKKLFSTREPLY